MFLRNLDVPLSLCFVIEQMLFLEKQKVHISLLIILLVSPSSPAFVTQMLTEDKQEATTAR